MHVSDEKKSEFWDHAIKMPKSWRPNGVTEARLKKVKASIFAWDFFWQDVVVRHDGLDNTPDQIKAKVPDVYEHCFGNFW